MANAFTANTISTFDSEMVFPMDNYVVSDDFKNHVQSMEVVHRNKFVNKMTGFESVKHSLDVVSGSDALIDIQIQLMPTITRALMQQLTQLAKGILSVGLELTFRDDWCESRSYSSRWVNAGQFVEISTLLNGASMMLECWDFTDI